MITFNFILLIIGGLVILYGLIFLFLYLFQEKLIFHPKKLPDDFKFHFDNDFEEKNYYPEEGVKINSLHFFTRVSNKKGIILYLHGNSGSNQQWGMVAENYLKRGYDLFTMDYRGFGKSRGKLSENALFMDAHYIYNYLKYQYRENEIIVYGVSLGTGIASYISSINSPKMLILETPYYSLMDLAEHYYPFLPHSLILNYPLRTAKYLKNVKCPLYIFHGDQDKIVYYKSSLKLKK
ncbi:MAG: alpha/beta hydrolase, partial [Flavobacteriales bacterium]